MQRNPLFHSFIVKRACFTPSATRKVEPNTVGFCPSLSGKALDDMGELHVKRSNAGAIQDDEEETRRKEEKVRAYLYTRT